MKRTGFMVLVWALMMGRMAAEVIEVTPERREAAGLVCKVGGMNMPEDVVEFSVTFSEKTAKLGERPVFKRGRVVRDGTETRVEFIEPEYPYDRREGAASCFLMLTKKELSDPSFCLIFENGGAEGKAGAELVCVRLGQFAAKLPPMATDFRAARIGMTRAEVDERFRLDGGLQGGDLGRYVLPGDGMRKIYLRFEMKERSIKQPLGDETDRVIWMSEPFTEAAVID